MRVHVSEDKSFKVSAKRKRHSIVGNRCVNGQKKEKTVGPDWKEANQTRGLIIHDSMRKRNSLIVSLFIY